GRRWTDRRAELFGSWGTGPSACTPLRGGAGRLATLSFASRSRDRFAPLELEFLQPLCHYVTVAYERVRLIRELREADRRKDEFLAMLAHELRNPLAPVRNALHIMAIPAPGAEAVEQCLRL